LTDPFFDIAIALTLCFAFVNGFHDGGNVVAATICSRAMNPWRALFYAAIAEFIGPVLLGTAVAKTMSSCVLRPDMVEDIQPHILYIVVCSAMAGAMSWKLPTWYFGLPSSGSHALIGGLVGAGAVGIGVQSIMIDKVFRSVLLPLMVSPILGIFLGYFLFSVIRSLFAGAHRRIGQFFAVLQRPVMALLAAGHGSNDAQKSMGVIAIILSASVHQVEGALILPEWVLYSCAAALALGLLAGGWRIVKKVGTGISKMEPVHAFAAQLSSAVIILGASLFGGPVSATQVVGSSVLGVGASRRASGVKWSAATQIAYAWILTFPVSMLIGAGFCRLLIHFFASTN
jgi:inorganic phosphate transporter, PiT family